MNEKPWALAALTFGLVSLEQHHNRVATDIIDLRVGPRGARPGKRQRYKPPQGPRIDRAKKQFRLKGIRP
jgi:hypothetical protein